MKRATQPSDIIWENRHHTKQARKANTRKMLLQTTFSILLTTILIIFLKEVTSMITHSYPKVDCEVMDEQYGHHLEEFAYYEFVNVLSNYKNDDAKLTGVLNCYCQSILAELESSNW